MALGLVSVDPSNISRIHPPLWTAYGLGAALASAAATANPGVNLTVDQAFVSAAEFIDGFQVYDGSISTLPVPGWIADSIGLNTQHGLTRGECDDRLPGYQTDSYNNETKAYKVTGDYAVLYAPMDTVRTQTQCVEIVCEKIGSEGEG